MERCKQCLVILHTKLITDKCTLAMVSWWTNGFYSSYLCENGWEVTYRSRKILKDICITKAHPIMRDSTQNMEMWGNYTASKNWMDCRISFWKCNWSGPLLATLTSLIFFFNYRKSYLNLSSYINDNISLSYMYIMKLSPMFHCSS